MLSYFFLFITFFIALFLWKRYQTMQLRDKLGIRGPKPNIFLGNMWELFQYSREHGEATTLFEKWRKIYGNTYGIYLGPQLTVVSFDLEMAKEIMIKQFTNFEDRPNIFLSAQKPFSEMLVTLHGENWKHVRTSITPTFSTSKLKQMHEAVSDKIGVFMKNMDKHCENGDEFDIYDNLRALTLDVIGKCAFAMDVNSQVDPNDTFFKHAKDIIGRFCFSRCLLLQICILFPELDYFLSMLRSWNFGESERWILSKLRSVIAVRKQMIKEFKSVDVLQVLLDQNNKVDELETTKNDKINGENNEKVWKLSDSAIEGNVYVFLLAGYETTATALGFSSWLLAKHQDVQRKLQKEIDEKINSKEPVNYEVVHKMPYMDAVFRESLRFYPPVIQFVSRVCQQKCTVQGLNLVPGVTVMFLPRIIHHDPEIWSEPEHYNPERFLNAKDFHPMAWLPFGHGPRNCVGMRFADMEYKLCLFNLLSKYNIEFCSSSQDPLVIQEKDLIMSPKDGVFVKLTKRV